MITNVYVPYGRDVTFLPVEVFRLIVSWVPLGLARSLVGELGTLPRVVEGGGWNGEAVPTCAS
jgi:hypothetical protein